MSKEQQQQQAGGSSNEALHKLVQGRLQQLPVFVRELIAGGAAGGLAKTCVAPLERTKIIFQTRGGKMTVGGVLSHIWRSEGVPGLFRGNTASVLRIVPYAAIHFSSFEYIRRFMVEVSVGVEGGHGPDAPASLPVYDLLAGSASGAIAVIATYPLDLVRTRLAWATEAPPTSTTAKQPSAAAAGSKVSRHHSHSHSHSHHPGIWATLRGTMAEEGLAGLYRGCAPTLLGILPYAGLKFYVYQSMKNRYRSWLLNQQQQQKSEQQQQPPQQQVSQLQQHQQPPHQQQQQHSEHKHHHHHAPAPPFETAFEQAQVAEADGEEEGDSGLAAAAAAVAALTTTTTAAAGGGEQEKEQQQPQKLPVAVTLVFGGVAGLVAQTVTYPLDVIRRQMQVAHLQLAAQQTGGDAGSNSSSSSGRGGSSGSTSSSSSTAATQASSSSQAPTSSSSSARTSSSRPAVGSSTASQAQSCVTHQQSHQQPQQSKRALSSSSRSAAGRFVQSHAAATSTAAAPLSEPSMVEVALKLWRAGGMFRGLSLNYIKVIPSTAIGFTIYDWCKMYLGLSH